MKTLSCILSLLLVAAPARAIGLSWSTYLGGSFSDRISAVATDGDGAIYVAGSATSTDFPIVNGYQGHNAGGSDVVVSKLSADGATLLWSTYLGGSGDETVQGIAVDAQHNVYVTGFTGSSDFPTTGGAYQRTYGGGHDDCFVSKLSATGSSLLFSTLIGGCCDDLATGIALDSQGNIVVAGFTGSGNFPVTPGVVNGSYTPSFVDQADGFVAKLNSSGSALLWSTFVGATGGTDEILGLALDASDQPVVTGMTLSILYPTTPNAFSQVFTAGFEGFVTKLNATGTAYVFSTLLNGLGNDQPEAVVLDGQSNVWVAGRTSSSNFATTPQTAPQPQFGGSPNDGFLSELSADGSSLLFSTFLGGNGDDVAYDLKLALGSIWVTGYASDSNFPTTSDAYDGSWNGADDAFLTRVDLAPPRFGYSTYLGGSGADVAQCVVVTPTASVVIAGWTEGAGFPTTSGAYQKSESGSTVGFITSFDATVVGVPDAEAGARDALGAPSPNPGRGPIAFSFTVSLPGPVSLAIYNSSGQLIRSLVAGPETAGVHTMIWDGRDDRGRRAVNGRYFAALQASGRRFTRSFVMLD